MLEMILQNFANEKRWIWITIIKMHLIPMIIVISQW